MSGYNYSKQEARECVDQAEVIFERYVREAFDLRTQLETRYPSDLKKKYTHCSLALHHILVTMQLAGQILKALKSGMTLISSISYRSLMEKDINAKYIFSHPKHKKDRAWVDVLAKDFWRRTRYKTRNGKTLYKSNLGGTSIKDRARAVRKFSEYESQFANSSGHAHNLASNLMLNDEVIFRNTTVYLTVMTIVKYHNIVEYVSKFYGLQRDATTEKQLRDFIKKWNK